MKILLFFTYGVSLKIWAESGLLDREIRIYQELIKKGFKVYFLTYGDKSDRKWEKVLGDIHLLPIYERIPTFRFKYFRVFESILIPIFFRKELKESSCFKTNQIWGGWVAVISKWIFKKPLIARCGYEYYNFCLNQKKSTYYCLLSFWGSWFTYRFADVVNVATAQDKDFVLKNFKICQKKVQVRPNWIDCEKFTPLPMLKNSSLLVVGRLSDQKNLSLLLESLVDTDLRLDLVGHGELKEKLQHEATELGLNVKFLGNVPNDKMPELYQKYLIYIICSKYEGNPKSLLEAMACGCVVIGTNVPGIKGIIEHEKTGLLVNSDSQSLRGAVLDLLGDKKKREKLAENASCYIRNNHSLEVILTKEISMFKVFNEEESVWKVKIQ